MPRNTGGAAFPYELSYSDSEGNHDVQFHPGMSLEDWFAGHPPEMPTEYLAWFMEKDERYSANDYTTGQVWLDAKVDWAWEYAAAMVAEREKRNAE